MKRVFCPYCDKPAELVTGKAVYPHLAKLHKKKFYVCNPCKAHVGCHPGSERPLGRLATASLRRKKMAAHAEFDPLFRSKKMSRKEAYKWLAKELGIPGSECHIGMFDEEMCDRVVRVCRARRNKHAENQREETP
jgi:hypothetical protein